MRRLRRKLTVWVRKFIDTEEGKFIVIGVSILVISQIVLFYLVEVYLFDKSLTNKYTQLVGLEISFLLNRRYTWAGKHNGFVKDWVVFHAARVLVFWFNIEIFDVLVWLGIPYYLINYGLMGVEAVVNYLASKYIVYRKRLA